MREEGKPYQALASSSHHPNIHGRKLVVLFPIEYDPSGFDIPAGQRGLVFPALCCLLGHARQQDHTLLGGDRARVENADYFEIILRGPQIRGPEQAFIAQSAKHDLSPLR